MGNWKKISSKIILDRRPWLLVEEHTVQLPDGGIIPDWSWVITPDFIIVVCITPENKWLCLRQVKYAINEACLSPVGGYIEKGEDPLDAAKRELLEETGFHSTCWLFMGKYVVDANRGKATGYIFLAQEARKVASANHNDLEEHEVILLTQDELEKAVLDADFKEMSFQAAMALALLHMKNMGS